MQNPLEGPLSWFVSGQESTSFSYYGGKLFYLQSELFYLQLSFFAYSPLRPLLDALFTASKKSSNCKQKAKTVSKKAPTVSKKLKSSTVSKKAQL